MSAFLVSRFHIDYLVAAARKYRILADDEGIGQILLSCNANIIKCRYGDDEVSPEEERYEFDANWIAQLEKTIEPLQVLKAIHCYEYQCDSDPEFVFDNAKMVIDTIKDCCIRRLPGYDELLWHIDEQI